MADTPRSRILVVDDEPGPRESLRMILAVEHEVHAADDGASALELLRTLPMDLVTVDLNMPGMGGAELMRTIREEFPDVEVIVITGYGSLESAVEGLRHGICDYLNKPFDVVQVGGAVSRALARRHSRRNLVSFLEGVGDVMGRDRDARDVLEQLEEDDGLKQRLRSVLQEPALRQPDCRGGSLDRRTVEFLEVLGETIEARDPCMRGHARRVAFLSGLLAERLCLSAEERERVRIAAFLHDLGKVGVPSGLIARGGPLEPEQRDAIQEHALLGERLIRPLGFAAAIGAAIRHHHEFWDGGGYPDGLRGEDIPLAARIIALCDAFDAITSTRPHRPAGSVSQALDEIRKCGGWQFDPHLAKEFVAIIETGAWEISQWAAESRPPAEEGSRESAARSAPHEGEEG